MTFSDHKSAGQGRDILPTELNKWWSIYTDNVCRAKQWAQQDELEDARQKFFKNWHDKKRSAVMGKGMDDPIPGLDGAAVSEAMALAMKTAGVDCLSKRAVFDVVNKTFKDVQAKSKPMDSKQCSPAAALLWQNSPAATPSKEPGKSGRESLERTLSPLDPKIHKKKDKKKDKEDRASLDNPFNNQHGIHATLIGFHFFQQRSSKK